jgi:ADP-dependent NAD(P)H-hydrate dehydratase / NAD(P)H-hydrate epimerase
MNKLKLSSKEMRELDSFAIKKIGISELVLMENAGVGIFNYAVSVFKKNSNKNILIIAGVGNNGGDALVAARHLINQGYPLKILLAGDLEKVSRSTAAQLEILKKMKITVEKYRGGLLWKYLKDADYCIEGLLGTGFKGVLREPLLSIIEQINKAELKVLAIDVPSGLNADTGSPQPEAIKARWTVTLGAVKKGLELKKAQKYIGTLKVVDIGLPFNLWKKSRKLK